MLTVVAGTLAMTILLGATGCGFQGPRILPDGGIGDDGDGATGGDAIRPDGPPGMPCYGPNGWAVCLSADPMGTEQLSGVINTDNDQRCLLAQPTSWTAAGQPDACFIVRETISVASATVIGDRPLVLLANGTITINTLLDVASHEAGATGPASPSTSCTMFAANPTSTDDGGGGGAGGSFMTKGGDGGRGDNNHVDADPGVAASADSAPPATLRGGCSGQRGAKSGGAPGAGGGAVYLIAGSGITGPGAINASGAGGSSCSSTFCAGSGGGSGGMIVLSAPSITIATLVANGGGGSSGNTGDNSSSPGFDPSIVTPADRASGGGGSGPGGRGFATSGPASGGGTPNSSGGGGGGGGGAGSIRTSVVPTGVQISPQRAAFP